MGSLLHLHDAHERAQLLLPWRANGTLDEAEAALLDAHLAECAECRADLAAETALRGEVASMPLEMELSRALPTPAAHGTARLRAPGRRHFRERGISLGWAIAGQAAAAAAVALFFMLPGTRSEPDSDYRLLASEETRVTGNIVVMFAPDSTQREFRAALEQAGVRLADGPTASGAFLLRVAPAERGAALERLRGMSQVVLAEPVDPDPAP